MATKKILAFDLGAESGRGVLGHFDGRRLRLEVIHRFPNGPVRTLDSMHWDVLRLHSEILAGLRKAATEFGGADSVGVRLQLRHDAIPGFFRNMVLTEKTVMRLEPLDQDCA